MLHSLFSLVLSRTTLMYQNVMTCNVTKIIHTVLLQLQTSGSDVYKQVSPSIGFVKCSIVTDKKRILSDFDKGQTRNSMASVAVNIYYPLGHVQGIKASGE